MQEDINCYFINIQHVIGRQNINSILTKILTDDGPHLDVQDERVGYYQRLCLIQMEYSVCIENAHTVDPHDFVLNNRFEQQNNCLIAVVTAKR